MTALADLASEAMDDSRVELRRETRLARERQRAKIENVGRN